MSSRVAPPLKRRSAPPPETLRAPRGSKCSGGRIAYLQGLDPGSLARVFALPAYRGLASRRRMYSPPDASRASQRAFATRLRADLRFLLSSAFPTSISGSGDRPQVGHSLPLSG